MRHVAELFERENFIKLNTILILSVVYVFYIRKH